ncbi:MAG: UDP-3-O-[Thermoguttaceae bacterium]|nr:UDP-3-O-[3-hydroxymyristoyl] N-acetylglucosamine deacetylase [Thermoguttaceae bacterium]
MQKTLKKPVSLEGIGFWRCNDVVVTLSPADPDTGIVFIRDDLPSAPPIQATQENRLPAERRTSLGIQKDGRTVVQVEMVEHLMAALFAAGITNCCVRVSAQELPALDGSALAYVEAINSVGTVDQPGERIQKRVTQTIRVGTDKSYLEVEPPKPEDLTSSIYYELNYPHCPDIGKQEFSAELVPEFLQKELAPARTFATQEEAKALQSAGLCQRVTAQNCLVFTGQGVLDNQLRFPNECARHKALDFIGDMYLGGIEWIGRFHGVGSGHALNSQLLEKLLLSVTRRQE